MLFDPHATLPGDLYVQAFYECVSGVSCSPCWMVSCGGWVSQWLSFAYRAFLRCISFNSPSSSL